MINLKNYIAETVNEGSVTVVETEENQTLLLTSITINGGSEGGEIKLTITNNSTDIPFEMSFTVDTNDVMIIDSKMTITQRSKMLAEASNPGMRVMVSAAEFSN